MCHTPSTTPFVTLSEARARCRFPAEAAKPLRSASGPLPFGLGRRVLREAVVRGTDLADGSIPAPHRRREQDTTMWTSY